ncbi:MAG: hypothetical protein U0228_11205 [Myxococcaceae bacterium]
MADTVERLVVRLEDGRHRWREVELRGSKLVQRAEVSSNDDETDRETSTRFDSVKEAREEFEHLVARYVKNGLKEVSRETLTVPDDHVVEQRITEHPAYERACLGSAAVEPWRVYADWLQEHGDVRGELASMFLNGRNADAWIFLARHRDLLLGEHGQSALRVLEVTNGFISALGLKSAYESDVDLAELCADVLGRPGARFVTRLRFGLASFESDNDWTSTLGAVLSSPVAARVQRLEFDDYTYEDCEISWTPFGDFAALWEGAPGLEHLHLRSGAGGHLGTIAHATLKSFVRESGGLGGEEVDAIVTAKWPQLEHLEVWTGSSGYGGVATTDQLGPILRGERLPQLRSLGIVNTELSTELLGELAASPLLPRLKALDLSKGVFTDAEVDGWLRLAPKFRHLARLDLSKNLLDERVGELKAALPNAVLDDQRDHEPDEDDDFRYVAVGE